MMEKRANDAIAANGGFVWTYPTTSDINITEDGSSFFWAVFAIMLASTFVFIGLSFRVPRRNRVFHYITASITMIAAVAYFSMASNLGSAPVRVEYQRSNPKVAGLFRAVFYVRYIDWVVTTPLLLLDLLLTAGLPWPTILYTILWDEIMIITGLVGALVTSSYKWGYWTFGMVALFFIAHNVGWEGLKHARVLGPNVARTYMMCGVLTLVLWFIYPIAWGVCEGGNLLAPDSEAVFYGILDVLAKPVFGALLLWGHRNIDPVQLGLRIRDYDDDVHAGRAEKLGPGGVPTTTTPAVHNGTNTTGVVNQPSTAV